jgi:hypothetical protein
LVELTAHRLLGHAYPAAAPDAQEAVRRAAQLLTANGPIGPYTSVRDAVRYVDAVVHLAAVQAGMGLPEIAGRTIESLQDMRQQLRELRLEEQLKPRTAVWALSCSARAALASGDVATANAYADAVLGRLAESGLRRDSDAVYVAIDADRLASDCRWAAGNIDDALARLHAAKHRYEGVVAGPFQEPGRLSPALVERLAEPLFGLYRDMADRLGASGEGDLGLVTRRSLVQRLDGLTGRLGDPARIQLASALTDLADDLLTAGRVDEAEAAAAEAAAMVLDWSGAGAVRLVVAATRARTLTGLGRSAEAVAMLRRVLPAERGESPSAPHAVALLALAEALRTEGDLDAAESSDREFDDLRRELVGPSVDPRLARSMIQDQARGVVSRGAEPVTWEPLDALASYAATTASIAGTDGVDEALSSERQPETDAWLEAERTEAHRLEVERLEQARFEAERRETERRQAERALAEKQAAERAAAERAARIEAERRAAAEEAEQLERKRRREERLEAHRLEMERQEAERREAQRLEEERRAAERRAADPAEAERLELERLSAELAELERVAERDRAERIEAERLAAEQAARERAEQLEGELLAAEQQRIEAERRAAERAEAERLAAERAEAERAEAERVEAERLAVERAEAERAEAERADAERLAAERAEAERLAAERAEAERAEAERAEAERAEAERAEAERAEAERAEAERAEAERVDAERLAAEQAEVERGEAERAEAERAESERAEAERAEAERLAAGQADAERVEAERHAAEQPESDGHDTAPDDLSIAQQDWRFAKAAGDRRSARVAIERVVELLRPRAEADLAQYGPQLQEALEELSSARLRSGDIWGSRAPAKEAKALSKTLGG